MHPSEPDGASTKPGPQELPPITSRDSVEDGAPVHVIRRIRLAHCKRGPSICAECREMDEERVYLLALYLPEAGLMQRRSIEIELAGERVWRTFEIVQTFADEGEARAYARENGIADIQL